MAILIGVIALAVIPNIQRSRESKDLTTLDNILSAANVATANAKLTANISNVKIYDGNGGAFSSTGNTNFDKFFKESMGDGKVELGSSAATKAANFDGVYLDVDISSGAPKIKVWAGKTGAAAAPTEYTSDPSRFIVTN